MSEPTPKLYSVTEAANAIGVSPTSVRTYTDHYAAHLSDHATGRPRQYTAEDLHLMAYVAHSVSGLGRTHEQTLDVLIEELDAFDWPGPTGPQVQREAPRAEATGESTAMIPIGLLQAAQSMIQDRDKELQRMRDELQLQRGRVEQLQHELGRYEGQLEELRRPWWKRILGIE